MSRKPRIGLLGIMQELYDDMIPGITEHQARYAESVAQQLGEGAEVRFTRPARNREDVETIARELVAADVDGIAIVMLTYGPAMRTVRFQPTGAHMNWHPLPTRSYRVTLRC